MKVLIGCEWSDTVGAEFRKRGHEVTTCDLDQSAGCGNHYQASVLDLLYYPWDLAIFFPPCDHLSCSGARWFTEKQKDGRQQAAVSFFMQLAKADIPRIAIENPIGIMSTLYRKPDQIIQPWQFGHGEVKSTCLWLKGLPLLEPTCVVEGREARVWRMAPGPTRARDRGKTFLGIAEAMADQWGDA